MRIELKYILRIILIWLVTVLVFNIIAYGENLEITNEINFEIILEDGIAIEPAQLDFGDLIRGTEQIVTRKDKLKFKTSFENNMIVDVKFSENDDLTPDDFDYAKIKVFVEDEIEEKNENYIEVYLKRVQKYLLEASEVEIPIEGEIRKISDDIKLGKYSKTINITVFVSSEDPSLSIK